MTEIPDTHDTYLSNQGGQQAAGYEHLDSFSKTIRALSLLLSEN